MDSERFLEVAWGHVLDRSDLDDPGVVDQYVDAAEALHDRVDQPGRFALCGDVAGNRDRLDSARLEILAGPVEFAFVAGGDGNARPFAAKLSGDEQAETAGAAGDQD